MVTWHYTSKVLKQQFLASFVFSRRNKADGQLSCAKVFYYIFIVGIYLILIHDNKATNYGCVSKC